MCRQVAACAAQPLSTVAVDLLPGDQPGPLPPGIVPCPAGRPLLFLDSAAHARHPQVWLTPSPVRPLSPNLHVLWDSPSRRSLL